MCQCNMVVWESDREERVEIEMEVKAVSDLIINHAMIANKK